MRDLESVDIAIISIASIALTNLFFQFDTVIVNGAIGAIVGVLGVNKYLASRTPQAQTSNNGSPF